MKICQLRFPGGKKKAFTMSYDDGVLQDVRLLELMNQYGVKGTFNLNGGFLGRREKAVIDGILTDIGNVDAENLRQSYFGHEVASHGYTHMLMRKEVKDAIPLQIMEDRKILEMCIGKMVDGFAYPFGVYDETVKAILRSCGIRYARTIQRTGSFQMPLDYLEWHPTCHHGDEDVFSLLEHFLQDPPLFDEPALFYLWGHSYEFDQNKQWDRIERILQMVASAHEEIWLATNGEIYHYHDAFSQLQFCADGSRVKNPTSTEIWLIQDGVLHCISPGEERILEA